MNASGKMNGNAPRAKAWPKKQLRQFADLQLGKMLDKQKNKGTPTRYLRNVNVRWFTFDLTDLLEMPFTDTEQEKFAIRNGDIMICEGGEPGRAAIWTGGDTVLKYQKAIHRVRPHPGYNPQWITYQLYHLAKSGKLIDHFSGTTIKHLPQEALGKVEFLVPPETEQRLIVAKLDKLFERMKNARNELAHVPGLLKRLKENLLSDAFSGSLTRVWRQRNDISDPIQEPLDRLCLSINDGDHQAPPRASEGIPFITISAMNDGNVDLSKATRFVPPEYFQRLKLSRRPALNDVLFSVTGSIGIPALVKETRDFVFQRHIAVLKPDPTKTSGQFLSLILASPQVQEQARSIATGTAQLTIPISGLRSFRVPCPTLGEQSEIINRLTAALSVLDGVQREVTRLSALLDRLDGACLQKAFRGELLPQDPNDPPIQMTMTTFQDDKVNAKRPIVMKNRSRRNPKEKTMPKTRFDDDVREKPYLTGLLKTSPGQTIEELFRQADLSVADFYKQLAWEVKAGHIRDNKARLEVA
jgi:type I restriction enzyme S subunit